MKPLSGRQLCRLLEAHGWTLRRVHGSHHIYGKSGSDHRLSVPVHGNRDLKGGLQRHLLKLGWDSERWLRRTHFRGEQPPPMGGSIRPQRFLGDLHHRSTSFPSLQVRSLSNQKREAQDCGGSKTEQL